ncbi:MAG: hypothetical protein JW891_08280, partial [Candidatus Lokiarchaeota archaeon]|nr:hypothetical protein [Candidatus Lokiarchaeota archaeon]
IDIDSYGLTASDFYDSDKVVLLRFACMIKTNNFHSIIDWKDIFKNFPIAFKEFESFFSKEKVTWYIKQCSSNLKLIVNKILTEPEYIEILKENEKFWKDFQNRIK